MHEYKGCRTYKAEGTRKAVSAMSRGALMARVLIVEGDAFQAFLAALQIQGMGHEIVCVTDSAQEAMGVAEKRPPEVAVLDLILDGDNDGVDLGNRLQKACGCKLVYTSTYEMLLNSLEGGSATLPKPYGPEDLQRVIEDVMQGI